MENLHGNGARCPRFVWLVLIKSITDAIDSGIRLLFSIRLRHIELESAVRNTVLIHPAILLTCTWELVEYYSFSQHFHYL